MLHIDLPTRAEIAKLTEVRAAPCVTIYVSTTPVTDQAQIDRIELKTLLKSALQQLHAADTPKRSIQPIEDAVEEIVADDGFWAHQANSLALFLTPQGVTSFRLPNRLHSQVHVSDRFHIKPLLRAVTFPQNAYVLAISRGDVRLVEVSSDLPPHAVAVPALPKDMADALGRRTHGAITGGLHGAEAGSEHALLTRYARSVDAALRPVLAGQDRPLIVAASEPIASIFRSVSSYGHLATAGIAGSPDRTPDHDLAAAARGILDGIYAEDIAALARLFADRASDGRATTDVAQAARAATFGAVDTLIVDIDAVLPGTVSDSDGTVTFAEAESAATYGVVDEIVSRALRSGARIVSARRDDVPGGGALAAILRYAI